jgi:membrane-bound metal-dependent hydrolase YbcI (DUF457 family)
MPSPIGHAAAGLIVALAGEKKTQAFSWSFFAVCMLLAAAPDLDWLIPGFHRGATHSIGFAALVTLGVAAFSRLATGRASWRIALICGLAYSTHIVMDWLGEDPTIRPGVAALWPFSDRLFMSGWNLFRSTQGDNPFGPMQFEHNLRTLVQEALILGPVLLWLVWRRKKQR